MALSITFYDNVKYSKDDFLNRDRDFYGNGVVNPTDFPLAISEAEELKVEIGRGAAWVDGYRIANGDEPILLAVAAGSEQDRIDIIQIGHDDQRSQATLMVKTGVPALEPIEPGADSGCIKLYALEIPAASNRLMPQQVQDRRNLVPLKVTGQQIVFEGAATTGANTYSGRQTAPQFEANGDVPIKLSNLASLPAQPAEEGSVCVVDGKWHYSTGTEWVSMAPQVHAASGTEAGVVRIAAVPAEGLPVAPVRTANANDVKIVNTTEQAIASYLPAAGGNFVVYACFRVTTAATLVTVKLTYRNAGGDQTDVLFNQTAPVGDWRLVPAFINAVAGTPIHVKITADTANQVYASSTIMGV